MIQDLMPEAERKNIDLSVGPMDSVAVAAQEIELTLLLRNILDNAIRYAAPGGKVEAEIHATPEWTTIEIRDDGPGIAGGGSAHASSILSIESMGPQRLAPGWGCQS